MAGYVNVFIYRWCVSNVTLGICALCFSSLMATYATSINKRATRMLHRHSILHPYHLINLIRIVNSNKANFNARVRSGNQRSTPYVNVHVHVHVNVPPRVKKTRVCVRVLK